jgi:hypothetical protein
MASPAAPFAYHALGYEEADSFRLLSLLPGDDNAPIECTLRHTMRTSPIEPYEALSYGWGDPTRSSEIILNGSLLPITHNLEQALRSLRSNNGGSARSLWVDAICINQSHVSERNHQVTQMGEIFAGAERVIIWFGEASADSDMAIAFMWKVNERLARYGEFSAESLEAGRYLDSDFEVALQEFLDREWDDQWEAVARLLSRDWWKRAWVVRELVVAKDATCRCGIASIPWPLVDAFIVAINHSREMITGRPSHPFTASGAIGTAGSISHMRHKFRQHGAVELWQLLRRLHQQDYTDPKDKVYSVLGMTGLDVKRYLRPDYTKPVWEVFTMAILAIIMANQDLDALLLFERGCLPLTETFPSWVADLRTTVRRRTFFAYLKQLKRQPADITFSKDNQILSTDGFVFDMVLETKVQGINVEMGRRLPWDDDSWTWDIRKITARLLDDGGLSTSTPTELTTPEDLR